MLHIFRRPPGQIPTTEDKASPTSENGASFRDAVRDHLLYTCAKAERAATAVDLYRAMARAVRDRLVQRWLDTQNEQAKQNAKCVYYLSSEFLTGRSLGLCLLNLGLYDGAERVAAEHGMDLEQVLDSESDPGLGNGGLGRLAACFMDSLATLDLPAVGYGIRYEYGIFEQSIEHGQQVERGDAWLQQENAWELPRHELAQSIKLYGESVARRTADGRTIYDWVNAKQLIGLPYDSFIVGHGTHTVNTLRLWSARASHDFDLQTFNAGDYTRAVEEKVEVENISKVLYPNDSVEAGKELRLKQQYFFVACSIADIVRAFKEAGQPWQALPQRAAVQLNDTHPAIAVAELMRVLVDEEQLPWELSFHLCEQTFGYTNHTLLPEALERWPLALLSRVLPRHAQIILEINYRFLRSVQRRWPGDTERLRRMSIIDEGAVQYVRMAHLATVGSHSINGVAQLHSELLRRELLRDFYELWPERFNNKTNGVTPRRWLLYANPRLARLVSRRIGKHWLPAGASLLCQLRELEQDEAMLQALQQVKLANKQRLASIVEGATGLTLQSSALFAVQAKRFHEYKRQLLCCLAIISHYLSLKQNPAQTFTPRAYVFAGKAAAGYFMAKLYIRLINDIAAIVNGDPDTRDRLQVAFVPNYGVTLAQAIIPAADLSLQISQAGKEASGTSNMKFALNGALTLGTLDGANVELREAVGHDNFFLFGLSVEQVRALQPVYRPATFIEQSPALRAAVELLDSDFFSLGERQRYAPVVEQLRVHDPYMVCADFEAYMAAEAQAAALYRAPREWSRRALLNIAGASAFSSDATIQAYASDIWHVRPLRWS